MQISEASFLVLCRQRPSIYSRKGLKSLASRSSMGESLIEKGSLSSWLISQVSIQEAQVVGTYEMLRVILKPYVLLTRLCRFSNCLSLANRSQL